MAAPHARISEPKLERRAPSSPRRCRRRRPRRERDAGGASGVKCPDLLNKFGFMSGSYECHRPYYERDFVLQAARPPRKQFVIQNMIS